MGRRSTESDYKARYKAISTYVDWKMPKRLDRVSKQRITKAHHEIAKALRGGAAVVRSKSKGRVKKANKIARMRTKGLRVAFVRNTPQGAKVSLDAHGQAIERIGGVRRLTLEADFFYGDEDVETIADEAKRLRGLSKGATAYAVKYASGGEGQTFSKGLMENNLFLGDTDDYNPGAAPVGIVAYWFPKGDIMHVVAIKEKQRLRRKKARGRW